MGALRIGLVFELLGSEPRRPGEPPDADAEYEPEATIAALEAAVRTLGHEPVRLGRPHDLLALGGRPPVDAALNIAEGRGSRNREAWAPVLLEMLEIPTLGSDALSLSLSLDKAWCKTVVAAAGVPVGAWRCLGSAREAESAALPGPWPLFVKPRWEGTAKGIGGESKVGDRASLARQVERVVATYRQPALVESFLPGPEYTVSVVGTPARALPVLQRALHRESGIGLHALERAGGDAPGGGLAHHLPGQLAPALEERLSELSLCAFEALQCRDFARVDFKLDARAEPVFLEINPLPTFAVDGSFGILAELLGRPLPSLLAEVFGAGLHRLGLTPDRP